MRPPLYLQACPVGLWAVPGRTVVDRPEHCNLEKVLTLEHIAQSPWLAITLPWPLTYSGTWDQSLTLMVSFSSFLK